MKRSRKTVGILAFQGDVIEHEKIVKKLGHLCIEVRGPDDLTQCDALIIPGGESTTIGFFLEHTGLNKEIIKRAAAGMPILGTCAGAIVLAKNVEGNIIPPHLSLLDVTVRRNAYGRQVDSFYADLQLPSAGIKNLKAAFIRAPIIQKVGPRVEIMAKHGKEIVLVRQGRIIAATFHPELRNDQRLHEYFISLLPGRRDD